MLSEVPHFSKSMLRYTSYAVNRTDSVNAHLIKGSLRKSGNEQKWFFGMKRDSLCLSLNTYAPTNYDWLAVITCVCTV